MDADSQIERSLQQLVEMLAMSPIAQQHPGPTRRLQQAAMDLKRALSENDKRPTPESYVAPPECHL